MKDKSIKITFRAILFSQTLSSNMHMGNVHMESDLGQISLVAYV